MDCRGFPPKRHTATDQQRQVLARDFVDDYSLRIFNQPELRGATRAPNTNHRDHDGQDNLEGEDSIEVEKNRIGWVAGGAADFFIDHEPKGHDRESKASERAERARGFRKVAETAGSGDEKREI